MNRLAVDHLLERPWWRAVGNWGVPILLAVGLLAGSVYMAHCDSIPVFVDGDPLRKDS